MINAAAAYDDFRAGESVVRLNSGHDMPAIGFGTISIPLPSTETMTATLVEAIEVGYRHFDTAASYGSEEALGLAVAEAVERGLISGRDQLFITTKLWCTHAHPGLVLHALNDSLRRLRVEYVDLYLIHFPVRLKMESGVNLLPFPEDNILPLDIKGTWEAMEECSDLGLAKSIGVSNFGPEKLSQILDFCTIPPAVTQVEMNVAWRQDKLRKFCKEKGIHLCAWSPLAANGAVWGSLAVMESPILKDLARARGKTVAQIALRWIYQQGATPVVKTFNKERMKQNLGIFGWQLTEEEIAKIEQVREIRGYSGELFVCENGPYRSIEEFWA